MKYLYFWFIYGLVAGAGIAGLLWAEPVTIHQEKQATGNVKTSSCNSQPVTQL